MTGAVTFVAAAILVMTRKALAKIGAKKAEK